MSLFSAARKSRSFALAALRLWCLANQGSGAHCEDIVTHTTEGVETLVRLGETIGVRT
jgi:hypothetical protein